MDISIRNTCCVLLYKIDIAVYLVLYPEYRIAQKYTKKRL